MTLHGYVLVFQREVIVSKQVRIFLSCAGKAIVTRPQTDASLVPVEIAQGLDQAVTLADHSRLFQSLGPVAAKEGSPRCDIMVRSGNELAVLC